MKRALSAMIIMVPLALSGCLTQQYEADCANLGIARGNPDFAKCMSYRELVQMQKDEQLQRAMLGAAVLYQASQPQPVWQPQPVLLFYR
jgi:hypothetical protein